jgi:hypothetical protein
MEGIAKNLYILILTISVLAANLAVDLLYKTTCDDCLNHRSCICQSKYGGTYPPYVGVRLGRSTNCQVSSTVVKALLNAAPSLNTGIKEAGS